MKEAEKLELKKLKLKIQPLIERLKKEKGMTAQEIAYILGKSKHVVDKYAQGKNFPVNKEVKNVVKLLENRLGPIDQMPSEPAPPPEKRLTNEENINYGKTVSLVSIFFDQDVKPEIYKGDQRIIGTITKVNEKPALIAYQNDSALFKNADGLIYIKDRGLEPRIKYDSLITLRKINKQAWRPGYDYLVIDTSEQVFIRKLFKGKNDEEVRLVSEDQSNYPDFTLELSQIAALLRVEKP